VNDIWKDFSVLTIKKCIFNSLRTQSFIFFSSKGTYVMECWLYKDEISRANEVLEFSIYRSSTVIGIGKLCWANILLPAVSWLNFLLSLNEMCIYFKSSTNGNWLTRFPPSTRGHRHLSTDGHIYIYMYVRAPFTVRWFDIASVSTRLSAVLIITPTTVPTPTSTIYSERRTV